MKKIVIVGAVLLVVPFATFAHGGTFADPDEQTATPAETQKEQQNHEQMQELMKKFMVNGTLSTEDANTMVTLMEQKTNESGMMKMGGDTHGDMMGESAGHHADTADGMMGSGIMWMNLLHGLVGVTSLVWLLAGILYLTDRRRTPTNTQ